MLKFHWVRPGRPFKTTGGLWNSNGYDLIGYENVKNRSLEKTHGHIEPTISFIIFSDFLMFYQVFL